ERGIYLGAEIRIHQSSLRPDGAPSVIPPRFAAHGAVWLNVHRMSNSDDDKTFLTYYSRINGVDYIFASVDRYLSGDECGQLHQKYFESDREMTPSNEWLFIDLSPTFRNPLSDVQPTFRRVSAEKKFVE